MGIKIIIIIIIYLKCRKVLTSEPPAAVELVRNSKVTQKGFEPRFKTQRWTF